MGKIFLIVFYVVVIAPVAYIVNDFVDHNSKPERTVLESAYWQYDKGYRSTALPDSVPEWEHSTKGDEYKFCIAQGWGTDHPDGEIKFCAWHAELGIWQIKG
jgi:hypothetical protein